jgi:hypothetical protein
MGGKREWRAAISSGPQAPERLEAQLKRPSSPASPIRLVMPFRIYS